MDASGKRIYPLALLKAMSRSVVQDKGVSCCSESRKCMYIDKGPCNFSVGNMSAGVDKPYSATFIKFKSKSKSSSLKTE